MSLYNIELFKKDFTYVSSYQIATLTYEYDYLAVGNNKLQLPTVISAEKGDYIRITSDSDKLFGIVEKVTDSDTFYTITYKPFISIFDANMYMDRGKLNTLSLENWLKQAIEHYFVDSGDALQNLNTVNITVISETLKASLDTESNVENLYELIKTALSRYRVCVDIDVDAGSKTINIIIGKSSESERIIEADLPNILKKEFTMTSSNKSAINKLYVVNEKKESEQLIYYLTQSGTVAKDVADSERITPVIFNTVYASAGEGETFEDVAYEKALSELTTGYENLIELTVLNNDGIVGPDTWNIGDKAKILKDGKEFESILTGKKYSDSTITLIFGDIRLELTKKIKKTEQKNLDTKVKNLESKVDDIISSGTSSISRTGYNILSVEALPDEIDENTVYLIQGEVTVE